MLSSEASSDVVGRTHKVAAFKSIANGICPERARASAAATGSSIAVGNVDLS
jgi:hypothetical protein